MAGPVAPGQAPIPAGLGWLGDTAQGAGGALTRLPGMAWEPQSKAEGCHRPPPPPPPSRFLPILPPGFLPGAYVFV